MNDTIVAPATPPGRGALGIVRVSGPGARAVAQVLLGSVPPARLASARSARRGGALIDRVVATFWEAPATPTGEDLLEICAHGSPEILRELVDAAVDAGARPAEPGEFTRRAFVCGRMDLAQAEAAAELIAARGARARAAALARLEGGLARALAGPRAELRAAAAELEARLDHPDEDLPPPAPGEFAASLRGPAEALDALLRAHARAAAARAGLRVCLAGRPNAGKSSLLNAWCGRERAIVRPEPGTTRDLIEAEVVVEGLAVTLVDTAGLREDAHDPAELDGISRAERALADCDVAVLVGDATRPDDETSRAAARRALAAAARAGRPVVPVWNKCDAAAAPPGGLAVSARTGAGLDALARAVSAAAGAAPGDEGEDLLSGARDRAEIAAAREDILQAAARALDGGAEWTLLCAEHLRRAHAALGRALGEGAPDEILREVFSRFCVGK